MDSDLEHEEPPEALDGTWIADAQMIHGDARRLDAIGAGEAALVCTSPPYFDEAVESILEGSRGAQRAAAGIWADVERFALRFREAFREMARVVGDFGTVAIETKDLRVGESLLPLADLHGRLACEAGLELRGRIYVQTAGLKPSHLPRFFANGRVGDHRALDVSQVLLLASPRRRVRSGVLVEGLEDPQTRGRAALEAMQPFWRVASARNRTHAHQSPPEMIRRIVRLHSAPGDLVVDPFAGSGQTLRMAARMGRRAVGYEIEAERVETFRNAASGRRFRREDSDAEG